MFENLANEIINFKLKNMKIKETLNDLYYFARDNYFEIKLIAKWLEETYHKYKILEKDSLLKHELGCLYQLVKEKILRSCQYNLILSLRELISILRNKEYYDDHKEIILSILSNEYGIESISNLIDDKLKVLDSGCLSKHIHLNTDLYEIDDPKICEKVKSDEWNDNDEIEKICRTLFERNIMEIDIVKFNNLSNKKQWYKISFKVEIDSYIINLLNDFVDLLSNHYENEKI